MRYMRYTRYSDIRDRCDTGIICDIDIYMDMYIYIYAYKRYIRYTRYSDIRYMHICDVYVYFSTLLPARSAATNVDKTNNSLTSSPCLLALRGPTGFHY